jgi:hypothetical protein
MDLTYYRSAGAQLQRTVAELTLSLSLFLARRTALINEGKTKINGEGLNRSSSEGGIRMLRLSKITSKHTSFSVSATLTIRLFPIYINIFI